MQQLSLKLEQKLKQKTPLRISKANVKNFRNSKYIKRVKQLRLCTHSSVTVFPFTSSCHSGSKHCNIYLDV